MSMMEELRFILEFQIKKLENGTFISQTKYRHNILKKFGMEKAKPIKAPMGTNGHLDLDIGGKSMDQKVYQSHPVLRSKLGAHHMYAQDQVIIHTTRI
jgi:hypothetical protein